jgi:hypothetical protein
MLYLDWGGGATDGIRTHDHSDHNRGLYQLSYRRHRWGRVYAKSREPRQGLKTLIYRLAKAITPLSDFQSPNHHFCRFFHHNDH